MRKCCRDNQQGTTGRLTERSNAAEHHHWHGALHFQQRLELIMCGHCKFSCLISLQTLKTHPLRLKTNTQPQPAKHGFIHVCTGTPLRSLMRLARAGAGCLGGPVLCGLLPRPPYFAFPAPVLMLPLAPLP